jgi:hypothetical protein
MMVPTVDPNRTHVAVDPVRFRAPSAVPQNAVVELEWAMAGRPDTPPEQIEVVVQFRDPDDGEIAVRAFWAGGRTWRARYSSPVEGTHRWRLTDQSFTGGSEGTITVVSYDGSNPLLRHGAPTVLPGTRHLAHADGTPFFWLSDSWLSAMTRRFRWPDTFQRLAHDRVQKGFTVIQLVAGLVPEFIPFSPETASEGGQPWLDGGHGSINPAYYSTPDVKIDYLVGLGLVPCIIGGWGHYANLLGHDRVLHHWRYLVARYGAYPVVWYLAGEANLVGAWEHEASLRAKLGDADFLAHTDAQVQPLMEVIGQDPARQADQVRTWEETSKAVRQLDPFRRIRTVEAFQGSSSDIFKSRTSFDLDLLQTGHSGISSIPFAMRTLKTALDHGDKPVLDAECTWEGIFDSNWQDVQRFQFWSSVLSGAAGYSYGTQAISLISSEADPHVPLTRVSVHHWEAAIDWPGSAHVGIGKRILERLQWWQLEPAPDLVHLHSDESNWYRCYAARNAADGSAVIYIPSIAMACIGGLPSSSAEPAPWTAFSRLRLDKLAPSHRYRLSYVNPRTGDDHGAFTIFQTDDSGTHEIVSTHFWNAPTGEDWLMLLRPI